MLYSGRSDFLWFSDGLRELLGDCNEKGAFFTNDAGNPYRGVGQGEKQTKFKVQAGAGTRLSRALHGAAGGSAEHCRARNGHRSAALLPHRDSPGPERLVFVLKCIPASLGELFILPRQLLFAEGCWRWVSGLGQRRPRPDPGIGSDGPGRVPFRSTSPAVPACPRLFSLAPSAAGCPSSALLIKVRGSRSRRADRCTS